jgi:hypothetical protein
LYVAALNWDDLIVYVSSNPKEVVINGYLRGASSANLYDIQGRLIISKTLDGSNTHNALDASTMSPGVYIVKVFSDNKVKTKKLVIK